MKRNLRKVLTSLLSFAILFTMLAPSYALALTSNSTSSDIPPCVTEDEIWYPANGVMPLEEGNECGKTGHLAPKGYTYQGYSRGNSLMESTISGSVITIIGTIPGFGTISAVISLTIAGQTVYNYFKDNGQVRTTYTKYIWSNADEYWCHIVWTHDCDGDGLKEYVACDVETYTQGAQ